MTYIKSFANVFPGRKVDAGMMVFVPGSTVSILRSLTESGGELVTGPVKLAQRVVLRLLSATGTYRYEGSEASTFATDIKSFSLTSVADIRSSLNESIQQLQAIFDQELNDAATAGEAIPLDEQLSGIVINSIRLDQTIANISLTIVTRAGTSFKFIAPVRIA